MLLIKNLLKNINKSDLKIKEKFNLCLNEKINLINIDELKNENNHILLVEIFKIKILLHKY